MRDGDVFAILGWGLRRYAWVVAVFIVALGIVVPSVLDRQPAQYDAQAQVGPSMPLKLPNLNALPRLGETVFSNGAVAATVRRSVDPPIGPGVNVIPSRVELISAQDNVVFVVIGHGPTPAYARTVANAAVGTFTEELNRYSDSVGTFAVKRLATTPAGPVPSTGGTLALGAGLLGGLITGAGAVALLIVLRRPVVDAAAAVAVTGAPVLGRLHLRGSRDGTRGLPQLCRPLVRGGTDILLLTGPRDTRRQRGVLAAVLAEVLGHTRAVTVRGNHHVPVSVPPPNRRGRAGTRRFTIVVDPSQAEVATRSDTSLTLLVVREGISSSTLRKQAERHLDDGPAGIVLVRGGRRHDHDLRHRQVAGDTRRAEPDTARVPAETVEQPVASSTRE